MKFTLFAALLVATLPFHHAQADSLQGRVVGVVDGDTIDVLVGEREFHRIRLAGIDAPEKKQPYGQQAKRRMADLVFGKPVSVEFAKRDKYKRIVGVVQLNGTDTGLNLIRAGLAWHYKKYQVEQPLEERAAYADAEAVARNARAGLWSDVNPAPPWIWRHKRKEG
ncbi:MAG: thermonuclease family protein [Pseudomonadota bacterium]